MSDDHASHAMSCYGSRINETPNLDRIANEGMRLDNCFCTNSICSPSRATILTGTYNHVNGVTTLHTHWDNRQECVSKILQRNGYQTAIVGKWHLGQGPEHWPTGFDYWCVLPGQGLYHDPIMVEMGEKKTFPGYVTDIITDKCIDWIDKRDAERPFFLMYHHKAPHRHWESDDKHQQMFEGIDIPEPPTFNDDHAGHATAAKVAKMRIEDMITIDTDGDPPDGLSPQEVKQWKYQRYIKKYLRTVASIDDNVGRLLDYLDEHGLTDNTIIMYTSDQGFFLGDHGWFDKRFMYEESLRMPFIIRYPKEIKPGTVSDDICLNVDFAPMFLDFAGIESPPEFQGRSFRPVLRQQTSDDWQQSMYYRYWMHQDGSHNVYAHYGVRTHRYKLICYYADPLEGHTGAGGEKQPIEWELFDLEKDPMELKSVYDDPAYADTVSELKTELARVQTACGDEPYPDAG